MELQKLENFRLIDRNKAGANATVCRDDTIATAEYIFYLQANDCLSIRLGRHDSQISTQDHEAFLIQEQRNIRHMVKPDVIRVRQEARARISENNV